MVNVNWRLNEVLEISGELYRVCSRTESGDIDLEHVNDNRRVTMSEAELAAQWTAGNLVRLAQAAPACKPRSREPNQESLIAMPPAIRQAAARTSKYVRAYAELKWQRPTSRILGGLIQQVAANTNDPNPPSVPRMQKWLRDWRALGSPDPRDIRCFAPRVHKRGNTEDRFDPDVEDVFWSTIEKMWLVPTKSTGAQILSAVNAGINRLNPEGREKRFLGKDGQLRRPSLSTVYRALRSIDQDVVTKCQRGTLEAEKLYQPMVRAPEASRPLEEVEIDHTRLDVRVLDPERCVALGRPWITAALDRYSRMIVGCRISFVPPSAHSVMMCLRDAIRPKSYLRKQYPEIVNDWPCYGSISTVYVDHGTDLLSRDAREAFHALGIDVAYCPAKRPRYKGKIERWFGRLSRQHLHRIPGTTFSNPKQRGDYKPEKEVVMTLADLKASILKWIVDDYSQSVHRTLGCAPIVKWREGVKKHPTFLPSRVEDLDVLLTHVVDRTLSRRGIEFEGLLYSSKSREFAKLVNRADKPDKVKVRIDHDDLSKVYVEDWVTSRLHEVPSVDPEYTTGLTLGEHRQLARKLKEELAEYERATIGGLIKTREDFRTLIKDLKARKKLSDTRLVRHLRDDGEADGESEAAEVSPRRRPGPCDMEARESDEGTRRQRSAAKKAEREKSAAKTKKAERKTSAAIPRKRGTTADRRPAHSEQETNDFIDRIANLGIRAELPEPKGGA